MQINFDIVYCLLSIFIKKYDRFILDYKIKIQNFHWNRDTIWYRFLQFWNAIWHHVRFSAVCPTVFTVSRVGLFRNLFRIFAVHCPGNYKNVISCIIKPQQRKVNRKNTRNSTTVRCLWTCNVLFNNWFIRNVPQL